MACARCREPSEAGEAREARWCATCEAAYDTWVRRYASDMIPMVLVGSVVVMAFALALPLLGVGWLIGGAGAVAGFATVGGLVQVNRWRRRRQFRLSVLPRAALVDATMSR